MRSFLSAFATRLRRDQRGATAVEYGIMVSLIAVVIIVAVTLLGGTLNETFNGPVLVRATSTRAGFGRHRDRRQCSKFPRFQS